MKFLNVFILNISYCVSHNKNVHDFQKHVLNSILTKIIRTIDHLKL